MTNKEKQDKDKDVNPVKKLFSYAVMFAVGCALIRYGVQLLASVWLPLLFFGVFAVLLTIFWRVRRAQKWRE